MNAQRLELRLEDVIDGIPVGLSSMPIGLLRDFHQQVGRFIKGSDSEVNLDSLRVGIEEGSYKLVLTTLAVVTGLQADLALLRDGNLDAMDPRRAEVVEEWQKAARKHSTRTYDISVPSAQTVRIHAGSQFERHETVAWVAVEKYLQGTVLDLGGKTKANLHLQLPDGNSLTIAVSQDQVLGEDRNLVYRSTLLRVRAEQHVHTGTLRNARLIEFVGYDTTFDADAFAAMVKKGRRAWSDVENPTQWVEDLRGAV